LQNSINSGMIPCNLALYHIKPRIFFPTMVTIWAIFTMINAAVSTPQHLMAIRFFTGIAESSTFVGTHYILGSWYTASELGKRSGIFTASGLAGTLFGGFLQTGIYSSMNGLHGLAGWRWLFIVSSVPGFKLGLKLMLARLTASLHYQSLYTDSFSFPILLPLLTRRILAQKKKLLQLHVYLTSQSRSL